MENERHYETDIRRKPTLTGEDKEILSEHGRILDKIDYRSHWFVLCKQQYGGYALLVQHGGGEERIPLGYSSRWENMLANLDSDSRYLVLWALLDVRHDGEKHGREEATTRYREAFVDGRLKKRKLPSQSKVKVWIEPKATLEVAI